MIVAGVDVGALSTDTVILDGDNEILAYGIVNTGATATRAARRSYAQALALAGLAEDDVPCVISTSYGRQVVPFVNAQVTEITRHARGAHLLSPETHTVVDIGEQDSKVIRVGNGRVLGFVLNMYQEPQIVGAPGSSTDCLGESLTNNRVCQKEQKGI